MHKYETHTDNTSLFIFCVTIQNHGGYEYEGDNYTKTVELQNMCQEYPKAEQYLSMMKESDAALEYLIREYSSVRFFRNYPFLYFIYISDMVCLIP